MPVNKVPCPNCNTVLKSAVELPRGAQVKCPQCKTSFRVPGLNRPLRIAAVLGGSACFLVLGGVLLAWCLSGASDESGHADLNPASVPVARPFDVPAPAFKSLNVQQPLIELTKDENAASEDMIRKGVAFLTKAQRPEGAWDTDQEGKENFVGFCGLTLLECGVPATEPVILKAAEYARACVPRIGRTYPAALLLLFFDRLKDPQDKGRIQELAMRLVAGQTPQGGWSYRVPLLSSKDVMDLTGILRKAGKDSIESTRQFHPEYFRDLPKRLRDLGVFKTKQAPTSDYFRGGGDNSNTQFALLALWAARRHNLPVDQSLALVVRRFRNCQNADGSFCYEDTRFASMEPSMTCAGLLGLAVGYGIDDKGSSAGPQQDPAIQKALKYVSHSILEPSGKKADVAMTEMYFLWSTERVAVLYRLTKIMDKDWFRWGFAMLRKNQAPDGSWTAGRGIGTGSIADTCFALLFLQRVNLVKDLTDKLDELNAALVNQDRRQ